MKNLFEAFARDESGATAIEYGLIAAGISVAIIGTVYTLGEELTGTFQDIIDEMTGAGGDDDQGGGGGQV